MSLYRKIRSRIGSVIFPNEYRPKTEYAYPFGILNFSKGYIASFGDRNPDKIFYVIWRDKFGSGFFSNFTQVISHIMLAEQHGWIPVVDYQNFKTIYTEKEPVNGTCNAWEYYFKQVSPYSLEEVYSSRNVLFGDGGYPHIFCKNNQEYREFWRKKIHLQEPVEREFIEYKKLLNGKYTLGIHFRGKEMNTTEGHLFAPTVKQMFKQTDFILEHYPVTQIFFASEEMDYLNLFLKRYKSRIIFLPAFRVSKRNAYNMEPRPFHWYQLGKEALLDSLMLSSCDLLLCSSSGITLNAVRMSSSLKKVYTIYNGVNSSNRIIARFTYPIKKCLPSGFGGLDGKIIESDCIKMKDSLYNVTPQG